MIKPYRVTDEYLLVHGDSKDALKTVVDESIDLTVTSPPYDDLRTYNGYSFDFESIAKELFRVTKQGGVVVWIVGDETKDFCESLVSFKQAIYFKEIGFNVLDTMIYAKQSYAPAYPTMKRYAQTFEYMFVLAKSKPKTFNPVQAQKSDKSIVENKMSGFRQADGSMERKRITSLSEYKSESNVWVYDVGFGKSSTDKYSFEHPAQFPEQLAADHIKSWSNEGDMVLDPFLGSGTTGKMAMILKRNFIGIEISEEYMKIAEARIRRANLEPCDIPQRQTNLKDTPLFATA